MTDDWGMPHHSNAIEDSLKRIESLLQRILHKMENK